MTISAPVRCMIRPSFWLSQPGPPAAGLMHCVRAACAPRDTAAGFTLQLSAWTRNGVAASDQGWHRVESRDQIKITRVLRGIPAPLVAPPGGTRTIDLRCHY